MDQHIIISACLALAGLGIGWMLAQLRAGHQVASFQTERRLQEEAQQRQQQQIEQLQQQTQQREQELRQLHGALSGANERLGNSLITGVMKVSSLIVNCAISWRSTAHRKRSCVR